MKTKCHSIRITLGLLILAVVSYAHAGDKTGNGGFADRNSIELLKRARNALVDAMPELPDYFFPQGSQGKATLIEAIAFHVDLLPETRRARDGKPLMFDYRLEPIPTIEVLAPYFEAFRAFGKEAQPMVEYEVERRLIHEGGHLLGLDEELSDEFSERVLNRILKAKRKEVCGQLGTIQTRIADCHEMRALRTGQTMTLVAREGNDEVGHPQEYWRDDATGLIWSPEQGGKDFPNGHPEERCAELTSLGLKWQPPGYPSITQSYKWDEKSIVHDTTFYSDLGNYENYGSENWFAYETLGLDPEIYPDSLIPPGMRVLHADTSNTGFHCVHVPASGKKTSVPKSCQGRESCNSRVVSYAGTSFDIVLQHVVEDDRAGLYDRKFIINKRVYRDASSGLYWTSVVSVWDWKPSEPCKTLDHLGLQWRIPTLEEYLKLGNPGNPSHTSNDDALDAFLLLAGRGALRTSTLDPATEHPLNFQVYPDHTTVYVIDSPPWSRAYETLCVAGEPDSR